MKTLLFVVKRIDGGTGTFIQTLQKICITFPELNMTVRTLVLEKPSLRDINKHHYLFHRKESFYSDTSVSLFTNIKIFIEDYFWIETKYRHYKPNIILGVDIHCNLIISILKQFSFKKPKIILTTHIDLLSNIYAKTSRLQPILLKMLTSYFYNKADSLVFVSKQLAKDCIEKLNLKEIKTTTIYNGVVLPRQNQLKKSNSGEIVITIARMVNQKDHFTLLKAFAIVLKKNPHAQLWLISDGYLKKQIVNMIHMLGIEKNVKVYGWVSNIYRYLQQASIFVLSSNREGFGIVLIEAMSRMLPIISTKTPFGPEEILNQGEFGILIPIGDEVKMANALTQLLSNKKKYQYYSKQSYKRSKDFSEIVMLTEYKNLISKLSNQK